MGCANFVRQMLKFETGSQSDQNLGVVFQNDEATAPPFLWHTSAKPANRSKERRIQVLRLFALFG